MHPKHVCGEEKTVCGEKKTVSIDPKPLALTCKLQQETQETLSVVFQQCSLQHQGKIEQETFSKNVPP
jgi:hypothetical protein